MGLQTVLKRELFLAYRAHVPLDPSMRGDMITIVRAVRVSLAAQFALVSTQLLVNVTDVRVEPALRNESALALGTHVALAKVTRVDMVQQFSLRHEVSRTVPAAHARIV